MKSELKNCSAITRGTLCDDCGYIGYCGFHDRKIISEKELTPEFVRDAKNTAYKLSQTFELSGSDWPKQLIDWYDACPFRFVEQDKNGRKKEVFLGTGWLFIDPPTESGINPDDIDVSENLRNWYENNFCTPCEGPVYITKVQRLIVAFTIIRTKFPARSRHWGKRLSDI
ncbi:hypothetical protein A8B75_18645 [Sphingomonadales bacterium EhC05]|nr:hypothetical protein A8B75_18645 [Sphingomonadales bacterium EhC05]